MRKRLAAAFLMVSSNLALAADPGLPMEQPPVGFTWTGFHVGANIGYGWADFDQGLSAEAMIIGPVGESFDTDGGGIVGGVQAGFNWRFNQLVLGIEADIQATDVGHTSNRSFPLGGGLVTVDAGLGTDIDWFGTIRGRLGFVPTERLLVYGTGGAAFGHTTSSGSIDVSGAVAFEESASASDTRTGWAAGAGAEYAFADNWTLKLEYLYVDLGEETFLNLSDPGVYEADLTSDVTLQTVRLGVNYKF